MPPISSDARFLGIDFHALWGDIRKIGCAIYQWPVMAWLTPTAPVLLLQNNGGESLWLGAIEQPQRDPQPHQLGFVAVELPECSILRRSLNLPSMAEQDVASAVALDVRSVSPFSSGDLVWGYHADSADRRVRTIEIALASRKQVAQYLATQAGRLKPGQIPEVWVCTDQRRPIVFHGYGEGQRFAHSARKRHVGCALLLLLIGLLAGIAVTPTMQLRLRAVDAVHAYDAIAQKSVPLVRQREQFLQSAEQLGVLAEVLAGRIEPLRILDKLTQLLPDETSVQSFKLQDAKVTIAGLTENASTLMQLLGDQVGLHDVRAPSAATRVPGAPKESFVIEFTLDPQLYGVVPAPAAPIASITPTPTGTPALPSASPAAPVARPASGDGDASFGGRAVFGGSAARPAP